MHSLIATPIKSLTLLRCLRAALFSWLVACSAGLLACSAGADTVSNQVQMAVTTHGFEPQDITVRMGEPVTLTITRKTKDTCATEIVIDEYGINTKLPLNQPVTIKFTPKKSGTLKYGCAMSKMIGGVITIRS